MSIRRSELKTTIAIMSKPVTAIHSILRLFPGLIGGIVVVVVVLELAMVWCCRRVSERDACAGGCSGSDDDSADDVSTRPVRFVSCSAVDDEDRGWFLLRRIFPSKTIELVRFDSIRLNTIPMRLDPGPSSVEDRKDGRLVGLVDPSVVGPL